MCVLLIQCNNNIWYGLGVTWSHDTEAIEKRSYLHRILILNRKKNPIKKCCNNVWCGNGVNGSHNMHSVPPMSLCSLESTWLKIEFLLFATGK